MKSLLDIQQELRGLETDVKNITNCIAEISADIDEMRSAAQDARGREFDYEKIEVLARQIPFNGHPLGLLADGRVCQIYLEMLLNIVRMDYDSETTVNRLIFIQWIQTWAEIDWSLEELFADACGMQTDFYNEFAEAMPENYKAYFMLDALMIANIGGPANREIFEYLVELSSILGITAQQMRILASVAAAALCRKFKRMEIEEADQVLDGINRFKHYIDDDMIQKMLEVHREVVERCADSVFFKWEIKQGQKVTKGECIALHRQSSISIAAGMKSICSPLAGTIYCFRDGTMHYGVISLKADNKDAIKAWLKAGGK